MTIKMTGKIASVNAKGGPNPDSYIIKPDNESITYLAHIGDLQANEDLLYSLYSKGITAKLEKGDEVQFEMTKAGHIMHVKKLN